MSRAENPTDTMILKHEHVFLVISLCVPDVFPTFLKIGLLRCCETPAMSASSSCRSGGMGVVLGDSGRGRAR
jgi:hypothetical protein